ncbi:hypothetical protein GCM10023223_13470 [Stackebrandtia albiflava]
MVATSPRHMPDVTAGAVTGVSPPAEDAARAAAAGGPVWWRGEARAVSRRVATGERSSTTDGGTPVRGSGGKRPRDSVRTGVKLESVPPQRGRRTVSSQPSVMDGDPRQAVPARPRAGGSDRDETRSFAMKREPVLIIMSVLAALQVFVGGAAFSELVSVRVAGLLALSVAALQVGMQFYVRGRVAPVPAPEPVEAVAPAPAPETP